MAATGSTSKPVYAIVGSDRFLRNEAIGRVVSAIDEDADSMGPTTIDGAQAVLADVLDEVRTPSLLGDRRIVIVSDADPFVTAHRKKLEDYCSAPSDTGVLILACGSMPKTTRLYKAISQTGAIIQAGALKGREVTSWITDRSRSEYGREISASAAGRLRDLIGDSPAALDAELSKLSTYVGVKPQIDRGDVDALVGQHREQNVFAVTDAISSGNTAGALVHWEQVLATDRAAPGRAIAGMAWGVRRLLEARRDFDSGASIVGLARRLYTDVNVLEQRLRRLDTESLEEQLKDLCAADLAVKTGQSTLEVAVERFIVKHSQGQAALHN